jgi:hypothetical protein
MLFCTRLAVGEAEGWRVGVKKVMKMTDALNLLKRITKRKKAD